MDSTLRIDQSASFDQACLAARFITMTSDEVIMLGKHIKDFQTSLADRYIVKIGQTTFTLERTIKGEDR